MEFKTARKLANKNQYDLTILTLIPQSKISLIENGYIEPSAAEKQRLAGALGLKVNDIEWPEPRTAANA